MGYDLKYGRVTTERGSIPDDEPVFLLRAQDSFAVEAIIHYLGRCAGYPDVSDRHVVGVRRVLDVFRTWRSAGKARTKVPDTDDPTGPPVRSDTA